MRKINLLTITLLTLSALAVFNSSATMAQTAEQAKIHGGQSAGMPKVMDELDLTAEQKSKLKPIYEEQAKQLKAVRDDAALSPEERTAKMKTIRQATQKQVREILTPEQRQKMRELQQKAKANDAQPASQPAAPQKP